MWRYKTVIRDMAFDRLRNFIWIMLEKFLLLLLLLLLLLSKRTDVI